MLPVGVSSGALGELPRSAVCPRVASLGHTRLWNLAEAHSRLHPRPLPPPPQVDEIFELVRKDWPGAMVKTSTFDNFTGPLLEAAKRLDLPKVPGRWCCWIAAFELQSSGSA